MATYHKDLPEKWIEIIEKDEVLKEIWDDHYSEYEAVPEFLFQALRGDMGRLKPIFALYGKPGLEMYAKLEEIDALTVDTAETLTEDGEVAYAGYFYVKAKGNDDMARAVVKDYIKAINSIYVNEFEEDALIDEDAQIEFPTTEESRKIQEELHQAWCSGNYTPENDMHDSIGDWFMDLDIKDGCEELKYILVEALYHISCDYDLSRYIQWSIVDMPEMENPFLPYYKLWCMGLDPRFVAKDKVIVVR